MRAALTYSGQPRDIDKTWLNHKKYLIEPLKQQGFSVDLFCHFWFDEREVGKDYIEGSYLIGKVKDSTEYVKKVIKPLSLSFEKPLTFHDIKLSPDERFPHPIDRTLSMFKSWEKVSDQLASCENTNNFIYDLVFRLRSDLVFHKKFSDVKSFDFDNVYVLNKFAHLDYGVDDTFAFSNSHNMKSYLNIYNNLNELAVLGAAINPETLLGFYLKNHLNLNVKKLNSDIKLFRVSYLRFSKFKPVGQLFRFLNNRVLYLKFRLKKLLNKS